AALAVDLHGQVRVDAAGLVVDPAAEVGQRHGVLFLAGDHAGAAADAAARVDGHGQSLFHDASARSTRTKFTLMPVPPMIGSVLKRVTSSLSEAPRPFANFNPFDECPQPWTMKTQSPRIRSVTFAFTGALRTPSWFSRTTLSPFLTSSAFATAA